MQGRGAPGAVVNETQHSGQSPRPGNRHAPRPTPCSPPIILQSFHSDRVTKYQENETSHSQCPVAGLGPPSVLDSVSSQEVGAGRTDGAPRGNQGHMLGGLRAP